MKLLKSLRIFMILVLLGTIVSVVSSCKDDDNSVSKDIGSITGIVTDEEGTPVAGATVTVSGMDGTSIVTGSDGKYTVNNVTMESHAITVKKSGLQTISGTIMLNNFDANKLATRDLVMKIAKAKIKGMVTDGKNGAAPLAGVVVSVGGSQFVTTGADGTYIIEDLVADAYTLTFTKATYPTVTKSVKESDFVDYMATFNVELGGDEIFRGITLTDLKAADIWYYSEYRGGRRPGPGPHWDWSTDFMCTMDYRGNLEEQNEGTTLRIRNDGIERNNPADLNAFDTFIFGNKKITADNKILTVRVRTHNGNNAADPAIFGVQVVDLSLPKPTAVKIGENQQYGVDPYEDFTFDLSAYVGKEITVAIGTYRARTGDYWKQLVIARLAFAPTKVSGWDWFSGEEVIPGWHLTKDMVRSTMPNIKTSFTGISPVGGDVDNYFNGYRSWRNISHIAKEWSLVPVSKDTDPFRYGEGFVIKTLKDAGVNTEVPQSYFYSKFAIASGKNELTLKVRSFDSNYAYFKLTAIKDDGTYVHIAPKSNTAQEASSAANGCWKFKHTKGSAGNPNDYASFVYDLSQFNGTNVVIALGVYKGGTESEENKLCIYSVDLK